MRYPERKNVIISIRGCPFGDEDEDLTVEMMTNGQMCAGKDGAFELFYTENSPESQEAVETTLLVEKARITMLRSGGVNSQMVFEKGRRHVSHYDTSEGALTVGITASKLALEWTEAGGRIEMVYDVEVDHALTEENHVYIDIRETKNPPLSPKASSILYDQYVN